MLTASLPLLAQEDQYNEVIVYLKINEKKNKKPHQVSSARAASGNRSADSRISRQNMFAPRGKALGIVPQPSVEYTSAASS